MSYNERTRRECLEAARTKKAAGLPSPVNVRVPDAVLAERDRALGAMRTPNMEVLGDPLPGRAALDHLNGLKS
jgi:hypothetical protein